MSCIKFVRGASLTVAVDVTGITDITYLSLFIGFTEFTSYTLVDTTYTFELSSEDTSKLAGRLDVNVSIDSTTKGTYKTNDVETIKFINSEDRRVTQLNTDVTSLLIPIEYSESIATVGTVCYDVLKGAPGVSACDLSFALSDETSDLTTDNDGSVNSIRIQNIESITFAVNVAPVGSSILVDVLKNGTTILTGAITLPASSKIVTITSPQIADTAIVVDDILKADITQIGASTAGAGAKIYFKTILP